MNYADGFYKYDGQLLYAPNAVYNANYTLLKPDKNDYTYPVDGWTWFDSLEAACDAYGLDPAAYQQEV